MISSFFSVLVAGIWPLVWHFGTGMGFIIIGVAIWWFTPFKQTGLAIAIVAGASLAGYTIGVKDANQRCDAKWEASDKAAVKRSTDARNRALRDTAGRLRNWRDPQDKDKP